MKSKLNFLTSISLNRKIKTKWFLFANIILALVIMCGINIDSIITLFGGEFNKKQEIYVVDNTNMTYEIFKEQLKMIESNLSIDSESNYKVEKYEKDLDTIKEKLENDKKYEDALVIVFNENIDNVIDIELISKGYIDAIE